MITRQQRTFSVISAFVISMSFVHMAAALALFSGPAWYEVGAALAMTLLVDAATWAIVGYQAYARRRLRRSRWVGALFGVALVISMTLNGAYLYAHRPASDRLPEWLSLGIAFAFAAFVPLLIGVASLARGELEDDRLTLDRAQDVAAQERAELGRLRLPRQNDPNRTLDAYTVRYAFALVRAAFSAAGVSPNPCKGVELPDPEDDEIRPMEKPQIAALLELLGTRETGKVRPHRNAAPYHVYVKCGLRLSEAIGLRRQDLDLDRREIRVRGQVQQGKRKKGKTPRAHRTVRFGHDRVEIFRQHCENQASEPEVAPQGWNSAGLAFCSETGAPPDQKNVWRQFMTLQERLDLMKPCPERLGEKCRRCHGAGKLPIDRVHDLRHAYGALAIAAGVDIFTLSRRMGHERTATAAKHLRPPGRRRRRRRTRDRAAAATGLGDATNCLTYVQALEPSHLTACVSRAPVGWHRRSQAGRRWSASERGKSHRFRRVGCTRCWAAADHALRDPWGIDCSTVTACPHTGMLRPTETGRLPAQ